MNITLLIQNPSLESFPIDVKIGRKKYQLNLFLMFPTPHANVHITKKQI